MKTTAAERRAEKAQRMRERLRDARHAILGPIAPAPEPGTTFDPLPMFFDPGWMESLRIVAMARIRRSGVGAAGDIPAGYDRRTIRRAAEEQAFQSFLSRFLDRDYAKAGITSSETARAVLSTLRMAERSNWQDPTDARDRDRGWFPYNRAQDSRTPDPRRVFHASRGSAEDLAALLGTEDDCPAGQRVPVAGGRYQPWGHGRMVAVEREVGYFSAAVILEGDHVRPAETAEEYAITETRWKMERRRGAVQSYPACTVDPGRPMERNRYAAETVPAVGTWNEQRTTFRPMEPLPPVTRAEAVANLRRRGRSMERGSAGRQRIAEALRRFR